MTLCMGAGVTGAIPGADMDTRTFAFGIYGTGVTVSTFTPASVTGAITGCTMPGGLYGPQGAPFNSDETIAYIDPGCANAYACITSTASCGDVYSDCGQYTITTNIIPDSIRVFGVEGAGNPAAGCYPNSDMMIDIVTFLSVDWTAWSAEEIDGRTRRISWKTLSEENNDYFEVQRIGAHDHHWEALGHVKGAGNSTSELEYQYLDEAHLLGETVYYRIKQVDFDGTYKYSPMLSVSPAKENSPFLLVPNPASDIVAVVGLSENDALTIISPDGAEHALTTSASGLLDLRAFARGVYFVCVASEDRREVLKLVLE